MTALETSNKFKVKGTAIKNLVRFIVEELGNELYNELREQNDIKVPGIILTSSWYSSEEYKKLIEGGAGKMKLTIREFMLACGRFTLEKDLHGVYKFFMRAVAPHTLLSKTATIGKSYSNVMEVEVISSEPGDFKAWYTSNSSDWDWAIAGSEGAQIGTLNVVGCFVESWQVIETHRFNRDGRDYIRGKVHVKYHKRK